MFTILIEVFPMLRRTHQRGTTERRAPHWVFESPGRLRRRSIQRAGRLTQCAGELTLAMNANEAIHNDFEQLLRAQLAA